MNKPVETILSERGSTHGNFTDNSSVSQHIKDVIRAAPNWKDLRPDQKESLDMIAHKIGRILAGKSDFQDHWDDLAGYAKLTADINRSDV